MLALRRQGDGRAAAFAFLLGWIIKAEDLDRENVMKSKLSAYRRQIAIALAAGLAVTAPGLAKAAISKQDAAGLSISQKLQAIREVTSTATPAAADLKNGENVQVAWWWRNWRNGFWRNGGWRNGGWRNGGWRNWHNWRNW